MPNIGARLKNLRGKRSRKSVAQALNISYSTYVKYERNERIPRDSVKAAIAQFYGQTVQTIFFD